MRIDLGDVTHVAVNRSARANFFRKLGYVLAGRPSLRLLVAKLKNRKQVASIADELGVPLGTVKSRLHYATTALRAAIDADARTATSTERLA